MQIRGGSWWIVPLALVVYAARKIRSAPFDRAFHTPDNQQGLAKIVRCPCIAAKGPEQGRQQQEEGTVAFRKARQRHSGVESAIGALQAGNGLKRCHKYDYTWAGSTGDVRALEQAAAGDRLAACWYSGTSFDVRIAFADAAVHQVSLYFLDWDNYGAGGRRQRIDVLDSATGQMLDTRELSSFQNGIYLSWNVNGLVTFRITNLNSNAVLGGLFIS